MKKSYIKPALEVENFMLNASIASNCTSIVTIGPAVPGEGREACKEFIDREEVTGGEIALELYASGGSTSFYDEANGGSCDCYYSAGGENYYTS